jgi:Ca-activated chloride channel family protein
MMNTKHDPYMILGIARSATTETIKEAYNQLLQRLHPNQNKYKAAAEQMHAINDAYNLLMDPVHRRRYDEKANAMLEEQKQTGAYFHMRLTPSKRSIIPLPETQVVYLLVDIAAPQEGLKQLEEHNTPLNLTLIIDHSKSMEDEGRMNKVKAAAQTIITELAPDDVISVVAFNDRATVIIPAQTAQDKMALRARVSMIQPRGGTEIFQGLEAGYQQNRQYLDPQKANHIILLTDGRTYGDEDRCIELARKAAAEGMSISAMGLGTDWNDEFLDEIASITGGASTFIHSVNMVSEFMDEQVRNLSNAFAERVQLLVAPDPDVELEMAFKLAPHPQPLPHENGIIPLASLQGQRPISVLLQFQLLAEQATGFRNLARIAGMGDLMQQNARSYLTVGDLVVDVATQPTQAEAPPNAIVDALSKLTLYRMQEKAQEAIARGDYEEATRRLEYLSTRLLEMGEQQLGMQAQAEAQHIAQTRDFSDESVKKSIKYSTRALIEPGAVKDGITAMFTKRFADD